MIERKSLHPSLCRYRDPMAETELISIDAAQELATAALIANRTAPDTAARVAGALVASEAAGQPGHGLSRVPSYSAQAQSGKVDGFARPTLEQVTGSLVRVDGAFGFEKARGWRRSRSKFASTTREFF